MNKKDNYMTVPAAIKELEKIEMIRLSDGNYRLEHAEVEKNRIDSHYIVCYIWM